jgi:hypothetical protein
VRAARDSQIRSADGRYSPVTGSLHPCRRCGGPPSRAPFCALGPRSHYVRRLLVRPLACVTTTFTVS